MKPKHARLRLLLVSFVIMAAAVTLILYALRDNIVFFYTPSQWIEKQRAGEPTPNQLRIGGLVKLKSVKNLPDGGITFVITDLNAELPVTYRGLLPSLFREGQGVVAEGTIADGAMMAETILAKHDENYMPKEVVEQLKKSGRWQEYSNGPDAQGASRLHSAPPRSAGRVSPPLTPNDSRGKAE